MKTYYVMWTYIANYAEKPWCIRAENAAAAIEQVRNFYSEDFKQKATLYAFPVRPSAIHKAGSFVPVSRIMGAAPRREKRITETAEKCNADRIDGYDRDDLGESPDY